MSVEIRDDKSPCNKRFDENRETCCVCETVRNINQIQKRHQNECCLNCNNPRLGALTPGVTLFNTRPFILYTETGAPFQVFINPLGAPAAILTGIFRVEEVCGCCAKLRALNATTGTPVATTFCVDVDLCRFIAIQCYPDTFIDLCPLV